MKAKFRAEITNDHFTVFEGENELVHWVDDEWKEDPETVVPAMLNALHLMYCNPAKLKRKLSSVRK